MTSKTTSAGRGRPAPRMKCKKGAGPGWARKPLRSTLGHPWAYCWVDVWPFERLLATLESASRSQNPDDIAQVTDKLMALYHGTFLQDDVEHPWVLSTRERLRGKLLRLLESVGTAHARNATTRPSAASRRRSLSMRWRRVSTAA